jgi:hypothetical protein
MRRERDVDCAKKETADAIDWGSRVVALLAAVVINDLLEWLSSSWRVFGVFK